MFGTQNQQGRKKIRIARKEKDKNSPACRAFSSDKARQSGVLAQASTTSAARRPCRQLHPPAMSSDRSAGNR